jgi:2-polyprenyl-3-methyl-5-hydroxy-6-metoxy-1,4-benzoquinol methylase
MSRIVAEQGYEVYSYDLDSSMIFWAKFLNRNRCNVFYEQKDVMNLFCLFDVVSATSLLSVVPNKKEVLEKLQSLLKTEKSKLILIEPTQEMTVKNVFKMMKDIKTFKYYFMFLIWAKARQNKEIDSNIFKEIKNISYHYFLSNMVRVTIIGQR